VAALHLTLSLLLFGLSLAAALLWWGRIWLLPL
jgi:hypothetical protein